MKAPGPHSRQQDTLWSDRSRKCWFFITSLKQSSSTYMHTKTHLKYVPQEVKGVFASPGVCSFWKGNENLEVNIKSILDVFLSDLHSLLLLLTENVKGLPNLIIFLSCFLGSCHYSLLKSDFPGMNAQAKRCCKSKTWSYKMKIFSNICLADHLAKDSLYSAVKQNNGKDKPKNLSHFLVEFTMGLITSGFNYTEMKYLT